MVWPKPWHFGSLLEWKLDPEEVEKAGLGLSLEEVDKLIVDFLKTYGYEYSKIFGGYVSEQVTDDEGFKEVATELIKKHPWVGPCFEEFDGRILESHDALPLLKEAAKKIEGEKG